MSVNPFYKLSMLEQLKYRKVGKIYPLDRVVQSINPVDLTVSVSLLGRALPADYLDFTTRYGFVELELLHADDSVYISIYDVDNAVIKTDDLKFDTYIPNSLVIGDNGGCEAFILVDGCRGFGVYLIHFSAVSIDESIFISKSLTDLLSVDECLSRMVDD